MPCAVILTTIPLEYLAVRQHLTNLEEVVHPNGTIYERGKFPPDWDITIAEIGVDNAAAEMETEKIIEYFKPDVILSVGLGGGINKSVSVGDVVASTKVYGYEPQQSDLSFARYEIDSSYELIQRARAEARKPDWCERIHSSIFTPRILFSPPKVLVAPIVDYSASTRSPEEFQSLISTGKGAAACDFVGLGFLQAVKQYPHIIPSMVIKGVATMVNVSGYVAIIEEDRNIAASHASAFAFEILVKLQLSDRPYSHQEKTEKSGVRKTRYKNLIIESIDLSNIRCFKHVFIDFKVNDDPNYWMMTLGDNAVGKSTLLKSIALGLCNESDAVALIKEMSGDFLREGSKEGYIKICLREYKQVKRPQKYTITTKISKQTEDTTEIIRQKTIPAKNFPWSDIFVCGYGASRSSQAYTSYEQYKVIDAVRSLFDPQAFLQNPEVILLRQDPSVRALLEAKLQQILMLDTSDYQINYTKRGLELDGPWGRLPFQVLSDGYRSTTQWVLDFIGWLIHAERLIGNPDIGGILLIDEIEQHLHPRWQRYIVQRLRKQFPKTQIIASTHTPLVAAGIADVDESMLLKLDRNEENQISLQIIDKAQIAGKRADQVLTSDAFGLVTTWNARSHDNIDRYTELLGKKTRTDLEEAELLKLRSIVQNSLSNGETVAAQIVERAVDETLQSIITNNNVSPEMLDVETKKQLRALFQSEN